MRGLLLFITLLSAAVWVAARPMSVLTSDEERQSAFTEHEMSVARTLATLNLTPVQKQALLPALTDSVNELNMIRTAKERAAADVALAMTELRSAALANHGVSSAVKKEVTRAEAPYEGTQKLHEQAIPMRAATVWALLTTAQGARLRRLAHDNYGGESDDTWINENAGKLKHTPANPTGLLNQIYRLYGLAGEELTRAAAVGLPIMQQWSQLTAQQARGQQKAYLRRLITALPDTGILTTKLEPAMERTIADNLLSDETMHLLDAKTPEPTIDNSETPQLTATLTDIRVLNLVNTLSLTPAQMTSLSTIAGKAKVDYQAIAVQRRALAMQSIMPQNQLRDSFIAGVPPTAFAVGQLTSFDRQEKALHQQETMLDYSYIAQVRAVLTDTQMALVASFTPGTMPAQSQTTPGRPGKVSNNIKMENALAQLRTLPVDMLPQEETSLNAQITAAFKKKKYRDAQIQAVLYQVPGVVNQARAMDDATFAVKKTELAQIISVPEKQPVSGNTLNERLVTYLCSANLIPIFTDRIAGK